MRTDVGSGCLSSPFRVGHSRESTGHGVRRNFCSFRSCLTGWATLGRHLKLPVSQFPHLYVETNTTCLTSFKGWLWGCNGFFFQFCLLLPNVGAEIEKVKQVSYRVSESSFVDDLFPQEKKSQVHANFWIWIISIFPFKKHYKYKGTQYIDFLVKLAFLDKIIEPLDPPLTSSRTLGGNMGMRNNIQLLM